MNRKGLLAQRGAYGGVLTDQILPPGIPGYHNWNIYPLSKPNITKAKKLMGGKKPNCVLYTSTSPTGQLLAQFAQQNLKQFGITADIKSYASGVMYRKAGTKGEPFDILLGGWGIDFNDPVDFVDILMNGDNIHPTNNNNYSYFNNAKYNTRMKAAARLYGAKRYSAYGKLDKDIMTTDAPIASYDNRSDRFFVSSTQGVSSRCRCTPVRTSGRSASTRDPVAVLFDHEAPANVGASCFTPILSEVISTNAGRLAAAVGATHEVDSA